MLSQTFDFTYFLQNSESRQARPLETSAYALKKFKVTVYPEWYKEVSLTWNYNPDWVNPHYNVYRSQTGYGDMRKLTAQTITTTSFKDVETNMSSKYANDFYVVEVVINGKSVGVSEPVACNPRLTQWHELRRQEMNRREWILLKRFSGQKSLVLKNAKYGQYETRCPECWDDNNKIVTKDNCHTCFGTSYKGGYYEGIPTYLQYGNLNKTKMLRADGQYEPADFDCWGIRFPDLDADDLIIRTTDCTIYRVTNVLDSEMLSNTVRQMVSISELPKTCVEYELLKREGVLP